MPCALLTLSANPLKACNHLDVSAVRHVKQEECMRAHKLAHSLCLRSSHTVLALLAHNVERVADGECIADVYRGVSGITYPTHVCSTQKFYLGSERNFLGHP